MKRKYIEKLAVEGLEYPNLGIIELEGNKLYVKNALPEQTVDVWLTKNRRKRYEGKLADVIATAPYETESFCDHFGSCGGCARQTVPYDKQLALKKAAVESLFANHGLDVKVSHIEKSPDIYNYRGKMEYSFGDEVKGGELNLGMHKKGRFYDVVSVPNCHIVHEDYNAITRAVEHYARANDLAKFNRNTGEGILRNLVIRRGYHTGEILIGIATSSGGGFDSDKFKEMLLSLELQGNIVGIYHLISDDVADVVKPHPEDHLIYGRDYYIDHIDDLKFNISFHSFFQTNTKGAEKLYQNALDMLPEVSGKTVFDLFSGTGTITQLLSKRARHVYGVEIIADAVAAAKDNAAINGIDNCTFLCGDVFEVLEGVEALPDVIVVDPPRAGMTPRTVKKLAAYGVAHILYISCNPKTMAGNIVDFTEYGYHITRLELVDLYPHTPMVEAICLLTKN